MLVIIVVLLLVVVLVLVLVLVLLVVVAAAAGFPLSFRILLGFLCKLENVVHVARASDRAAFMLAAVQHRASEKIHYWP